MAQAPSIHEVMADFSNRFQSMSEIQMIWTDVVVEIGRARDKHGLQHHLPMGTGPERSILTGLLGEPLDNVEFEELAKKLCETGKPEWARIVLEEFAEVVAADEEHLDAELVQLIAMGVSMLQAHRRQRAAR